MTETIPDPRIALLTEQDRRLLLVGQGTMGMVLAAAEKAGLIPPSTATTEYGVLRTPTDHLFPQLDAEGAHGQAHLMNMNADDFTYTPVSRTRTVFAKTITDWTPLSGEETHA